MGKKMTEKTSDGGFIIIEEKDDGGFAIDIKRGYKEIPAERKARIQNSKRGGYHKDKNKESRSKVKQKLKKELLKSGKPDFF